jgi:hypothetical protein
MRSDTSISATPPLPQLPPKPRRVRRKSAKVKPRPDPEVGATKELSSADLRARWEVFRLQLEWQQLTREQLEERVHRIRLLAVKGHLGDSDWAFLDKMRARIRSAAAAHAAANYGSRAEKRVAGSSPLKPAGHPPIGG